MENKDQQDAPPNQNHYLPTKIEIKDIKDTSSWLVSNVIKHYKVCQVFIQVQGIKSVRN